MKNYAYAIHVSGIVRDSTFRLSELTRGMWNPDFCSADASAEASNFAKYLRACADTIERNL